MKYVISIFIVLVILIIVSTLIVPQSEWPGVDDAVIKRIAAEANCQPADPLLNIRGDALLFVFLIAGAVGGFIAGYYFKTLFPPKVGEN